MKKQDAKHIAKTIMTNQRRMLKQTIYKKRVKWTMDGYQPLCAICGEPPRNGALQMHEALITRGDVSGDLELQYDIMVECNCVLVHDDCHVYANTDQGKIACIKNLLEYNEYTNIQHWLMCMDARMKGTTAIDTLRLVKEVKDEV